MAIRNPLVLVDGEIQQLQAGDSLPPVLDTSNGLISGGGVFWTGSLDFTVSAATYKIAGVLYNSIQTNVSLMTADPTNDRIDIIAVDDTGSVIVIMGTPAPSPIAPDVDPASQLQLTFILVSAGATVPVITNENIYLENTEWGSSVTGGFNAVSTSNPFAGSKDIEATSAVAGNKVTLSKPSGILNLGEWDTLTFQIRSKAAWPTTKGLSIVWLNGSTLVGLSVVIKSGTYGFNSSNTTTYQQITIPLEFFAAGSSPVNKLRIAVTGGGAAIGFYLDNIILQGGVSGAVIVGSRNSFVISRTIAGNSSYAGFQANFPNTFDILSISSSTALTFRLRLYSNATAQTNDVNRSVYVPPQIQTQHGVIMDLVLNTTTGYTWVMSPIARGSLSDDDGKLYYTIDNLTGASNTFAVTVNFLGGET